MTRSLATVLGTLLLAISATADDGALNTLTKKEKADGWKLLFDGKTLDGWMNWKTKKPAVVGKWVVKDDAMVLEGKGGGDLYTAKAYEHFEFSLEFKTRGNSGVFIRVDPSARGAIYGVAPEIQVNRDGPKSLSSTSTGGLYALYEIKLEEKIIHPDGWNSMRIRIVDNKGVHWMNGKKLYEYEIGGDEWKTRLRNSKFKKAIDTFGMKANGHLGLQDHGATVAYRNLKIKVIK